MPILNVYVDDETMERLEAAARDTSLTPVYCAECAVAESLLQWANKNPRAITAYREREKADD